LRADVRRRGVGNRENAHNRTVVLQGQVAYCNACFFLLMLALFLALLNSSSILIGLATLNSIVVTSSIVLTKAEESILAAIAKSHDQIANYYNKQFTIKTFTTDIVVVILIPKNDCDILDYPKLYA